MQQATRPSAFCLTVVSKKSKENVQEVQLAQNQMWIRILMHVIVHFYLNNSPGPATSSTIEVYDINSALGLATVAAISNAQSYVWYSACKSLLFSPEVEISCKSDLSRPSWIAISVHSVINALCRNFATSTNDDPGSCRGRYLSEYGATDTETLLTNASVIINGQTEWLTTYKIKERVLYTANNDVPFSSTRRGILRMILLSVDQTSYK